MYKNPHSQLLPPATRNKPVSAVCARQRKREIPEIIGRILDADIT